MDPAVGQVVSRIAGCNHLCVVLFRVRIGQGLLVVAIDDCEYHLLGVRLMPCQRRGFHQLVGALLCQIDAEKAVFTGGIGCPRLRIGSVRLLLIQGERNTLQTDGFIIIIMLFIDLGVLRVILVQLKAGFKGRVDEVGACRLLLSGGKRGNRVILRFVRRQNVHIDILPIAAVPVARVVFGGNLHGETLALIIRLIRGVGFRELIAAGVLAQDNGLSNNRILVVVVLCDVFAAGIEDQAVGVVDGFPYQMACGIGDSSTQFHVSVQRLHFKFRAGQNLITGILTHHLLQVHRGDDGFIHHCQDGVIEVRGFAPVTFRCWFTLPRPDIELGNNIAILRGGAEQLERNVFRREIARRRGCLVEGVDGVFPQLTGIKLMFASVGSPACYQGSLCLGSLVDFQHSAGEEFTVQTPLIAGFAVTLNVIALGDGNNGLLILDGEVQSGVFAGFRNDGCGHQIV